MVNLSQLRSVPGNVTSRWSPWRCMLSCWDWFRLSFPG